MNSVDTSGFLCYKCTKKISTLNTLRDTVKGGTMIIIDYNDKRPIYEQVAERFQNLILSGVMESDEKLPSVRSLAIELSINPNTIQRAFAQLERDGLIYSVKGVGNFVQVSESLKQKQKEKLMKEFEEHVNSCISQGITKEELLKGVEKAAGEVKA